jgi:hypothetical protein
MRQVRGLGFTNTQRCLVYETGRDIAKLTKNNKRERDTKKKQLVGITEEGSAGARLTVSKHDRNDKLGRWRN